MAHFPVGYDIQNLLQSVNTPIADAQETRFFGNGGSIMMVESTGANYVKGAVVNGIVQPGTIFIGTYAVDRYAAAAELSPIQAAKAMAIHEMGHARYQQSIYQAQPGDSAPMDAKVAWCMLREGTASFYAFTVAKEMGWHVVAGTSKTPNLYDTIEAALGSIDPRSSVYEQVGIAAAKAAFAADPQYVAYCSNPSNWNKPSYIPPSPPSTSPGGPGTGSVINSVYDYPPEPGGYWQPVPTHPSDVVLPDPLRITESDIFMPPETTEGQTSLYAVDNKHSEAILADLVGVQTVAQDTLAM